METIMLEIREVLDDSGLPKAVREKLEGIIGILEGAGDERLKANKVLCELEELSYNTTIPSFIRTQLWNIASQLESL